MYPPDIFRHSLLRLVAILHRHGVRFHLTGGITSVAYGEPRMTQDVDVVVENAAITRAIEPFIAAARATRTCGSRESCTARNRASSSLSESSIDVILPY